MIFYSYFDLFRDSGNGDVARGFSRRNGMKYRESPPT